MTTAITAWADLPNAKQIDRVLAALKADPRRFTDAAWGAAREAARGAARGAAWSAAWGAARDAVNALIAWDDCACLLDLPPDAVRLIATSGNHAAVLLLHTIIALNKELT